MDLQIQPEQYLKSCPTDNDLDVHVQTLSRAIKNPDFNSFIIPYRIMIYLVNLRYPTLNFYNILNGTTEKNRDFSKEIDQVNDVLNKLNTMRESLIGEEFGNDIDKLEVALVNQKMLKLLTSYIGIYHNMASQFHYHMS